MSFGIKIFGTDTSIILDSTYRSYRLLAKHTNVSLNNSFTVTSSVVPITFCKAYSEGTSIQNPVYGDNGNGTWSVDTSINTLKTVPWASASTIAPITWNGQVPPFQYNNDAATTFDTTSQLDLGVGEDLGDVYIFGVQDDSDTFGAAMFDSNGVNPFVLSGKPLVVVDALSLDPRPWSYSPGTDFPTYGPNDPESYIDHTKITPNGNYGKIALLPNSISPGKAAVSPGAFVLSTALDSDGLFSELLNNLVFRWYSGQFIIGGLSGVAEIDNKLTTWSGNFHLARQENRANEPIEDYVTILIIDTDMYL